MKAREILILAVVVMIAGAVVGLRYGVQHAREAARRTQCLANLKQISHALHIYRDVNGSFPPAYIADENGKPMHSWRVLILPYIDGNSFYERYDFSEPWDGPHNSQLAHGPDAIDAGRLFRCPTDENDRPSTFTNFVALVGENTAWPGSEPLTLTDEEFEAKRLRIMLVEMADSNIHWMEPRDLTYRQAVDGVNQPGKGISSEHDHVFHFCRIENSIGRLSKEIDRKTLEKLLEY